MKRLTIRYGDMTLFDGDVSALKWEDEAGAVRVEGRIKAPGGGLADLLTGLSKTKTQQDIQARREEYTNGH